jgi:Domain of unknown function (DUF4157)/D-alanyl-D-alanine carboxypeptidase
MSKDTKPTHDTQQSGKRTSKRQAKLGPVPVRAEDRRGVRELLRGGAAVVQAKLQVGDPNDELEREADRVADHFDREDAAGRSSAAPVAGALRPPPIQRMCATCEEEVHLERDGRKSEPPEAAETDVEAALRSSGESLPAATRSQLEHRIGHDFSRVRVHRDQPAAKTLSAHAFTIGHDVVFAEGRYQPDTREGRKLLAHELTHVVQQGEASSTVVQRQTGAEMQEPVVGAAAAGAAAAGVAEAATSTCALTTYTGSNFVGDAVTADVEFVDSLGTINQHAADNSVNVYVTDSFRASTDVVTGAIVTPATNSNHKAGHAIDMNVQSNGTLYNSTKLKQSELTNQPQPVQDFIQAIRDDTELRWGGDFSTEDPVHIDDDLNSDGTAYAARYDATQAARTSGCG